MSTEVSSTSSLKDNDEFFLSAEELETYYNMLENGTILELEWQCSRRAPSPDATSSSGSKEQSNSVDATETQEPANDFDFSDDVAASQMPMRARHGTPKSQKKKTANFAGVMEALKKKNAKDQLTE